MDVEDFKDVGLKQVRVSSRMQTVDTINNALIMHK